MAVSSKAELTKQFLETIAREAAGLGFVQKPRNVLSKACAGESILSIRYEFFGSAIIDAAAYVGVRLPSVEKRLSNMAFFEGWPASTVRETVFQKMDAVVAAIEKGRIPSSVKLADNEGDHVLDIKRYAGDLESTFCDVEKLAEYCKKDKSLPLGHHAFRVPFILRDAGMENICQSYMAEVSAKNFINGYDNFVSEFDELR